MNAKLAMRVFRDAPFAGSQLTVLMAVAYLANSEGLCQAPLERIAALGRVGRRQCLRVLEELAGTPSPWLCIRQHGGGRGRATLYQVVDRGLSGLQLQDEGKGVTGDTFFNPETVSPKTPFSATQKGDAGDTLSDPETVSPATLFFPENGVTDDTVSRTALGNGVTDDTVSRTEPGNGVAGDTVSALARVEDSPLKKEGGEEKKEEEGDPLPPPPPTPGRSLTPGQVAVAEFLGIVTETETLKAPEKSRIGQWLKALRESGLYEDPLAQLLELLKDQIGAGLEGRADPWAYFHACVRGLAAGQSRSRGLFPAAKTAGTDSVRAGQAARLQSRARRAG